MPRMITAFLAVPSLFVPSLFMLSLFALSSPAPAQQRHEQTGTLNMVIEDKSKDPYKESQANAMEAMNALSKKIEELKTGSISRAERPKDSGVHYLTGVYLYCTITKGTCPEILDSILEIDLINSRIEKKASCPTMLSFWKDWQANDMEARQKFMVRLGYLGITNDFNRNVRPAYVKCQETIAGRIDDQASDADFFRKRYGADQSPEQSVRKTVEYLQAVSTSIGDVFLTIQNMKK